MPGGPQHGGQLVAIPGMRIRLTRNVDKERGFVNGALAHIEHVLAPDVFIAKTPAGVHILVHRVAYRDAGRRSFMPFCYGYAMTMRRAQGSTLEFVGLFFDHKYPADRGYAYVGNSRVRKAECLYLMGKLKRTDWLPVNGNEEEEQLTRGIDNEDTESNSDQGSEDQGASSSDDDQGSEDQGASSSSDEDQAVSSSASSSLEDQGASDHEDSEDPADAELDSDWDREGGGDCKDEWVEQMAAG